MFIMETHAYKVSSPRVLLLARLRSEEVSIFSLSSGTSPERQLTSTLEELKESQDMVAELRKPPPDVPGADRQELLRLLDRR